VACALSEKQRLECCCGLSRILSSELDTIPEDHMMSADEAGRLIGEGQTMGERAFRSDVDPAKILELSFALRHLAETMGGLPQVPSGFRLSPEFVRSIIRARRGRPRFSDQDLFADPAWDMLLDLTAARLEGREVSVSSLCIAAAVPATTALRWIGQLCKKGVLVRRTDQSDGRRVLVQLAEDPAAKMIAYLEAAQAGGLAVV
jgi:hypothetical protein